MKKKYFRKILKNKNSYFKKKSQIMINFNLIIKKLENQACQVLFLKILKKFKKA